MQSKNAVSIVHMIACICGMLKMCVLFGTHTLDVCEVHS